MSDRNAKDEFKSDCYSAGERGWMEYGQRIRASLLLPVNRTLTQLRISPDAVTLVSGLFGFAFLPLWLMGQPLVALCCLLVHVLLDGLDGPLARYQETATSRGSFTDTFTDQIVVTVVVIAWMAGEKSLAAILAGSTYIFVYALVVAIAMVRNALDIPYSWLIRPRFFVFVAIAFDWAFSTSLTIWLLALCNLLLIVRTGSGFLKLRDRLPKE